MLHELLEKSSSFVNKVVLLVPKAFLLWDCWNIYSWPPMGEGLAKGMEFRVPSKLFKVTFRINSPDRIFDMVSHLNRVRYGKLGLARVFELYHRLVCLHSSSLIAHYLELVHVFIKTFSIIVRNIILLLLLF